MKKGAGNRSEPEGPSAAPRWAVYVMRPVAGSGVCSAAGASDYGSDGNSPRSEVGLPRRVGTAPEAAGTDRPGGVHWRGTGRGGLRRVRAVVRVERPAAGGPQAARNGPPVRAETGPAAGGLPVYPHPDHLQPQGRRTGDRDG